ncbi:sporulation inhibitor of replication protein SirA [Alkalihalobacillus berkeleyi]|uniref:Sporulation inhibitor of replication protein SirA n=1 Tax=Pseudalkalibacillus berkeleyi TaxID=1069813 RepID=A0ABS9H0D3_9BACL|nr:sporulation inhibitor of replication protein SirA [Pseudalkalibacillus berkeleyi]
MEKEVAYHYYGREQVLYHFFVEAVQPVPALIHTIDKQLHYITQVIPKVVFEFELKKIDSYRMRYNLKKESRKLMLSSEHSMVILEKKERKLTLISTGNFEAETLLFEHLRNVENTFIAINIEGNSIGWLSPIKQAHYI